MSDISKTGLRALRWLHEHGGEGVIDKSGYIIAEGERSRHVPETWLRLVATGHLAGAGKGRVALTVGGRIVADRQPPQSSSAEDKFGAQPGRADPLGEYADGEVGYVR